MTASTPTVTNAIINSNKTIQKTLLEQKASLTNALSEHVPQLYPEKPGFHLFARKESWDKVLSPEQKSFVTTCIMKRCQAFPAYRTGGLAKDAVLDAANEVFDLLNTVLMAKNIGDEARKTCYDLAGTIKDDLIDYSTIIASVNTVTGATTP